MQSGLRFSITATAGDELGFVLYAQSWWYQYRAGLCADIETLAELHDQHHMPYNEVMSSAAAQSGCISKLHWLLDVQRCP
jgi:hypothetical protein